MPELENNLIQETNLEKEQKNFLETNLGKVVNTGLDIGIRALLPDVIEEQVIDVKDAILQNGFKEGVKQAIDSAIDLGKSVIGIFTGNFETVGQAQNAIKNGGIIDGISDSLDFVLDKMANAGNISNGLIQTIKKGKDVVLDSISNKIESNFNEQLDAAEKLQKYSNNWKEYFSNKDFEGMEKEYQKMKEKLKLIIPLENTLTEARTIENLHQLIKNNNKSFNLTEEQLELVTLLQ